MLNRAIPSDALLIQHILDRGKREVRTTQTAGTVWPPLHPDDQDPRILEICDTIGVGKLRH